MPFKKDSRPRLKTIQRRFNTAPKRQHQHKPRQCGLKRDKNQYRPQSERKKQFKEGRFLYLPIQENQLDR